MAESENNNWVTLVLVCLAQFMVILDATIVNVALPTIQKDLKFSQADLQWVVNSYTLMFGGFLLLGGRAADILGRKRIFIAGTIVFSVASLLNGLATSSGQLIVFRGLQGLGGALVSPAALSHHHHDVHRRAGADEGARRLERDRGGRRRVRTAARRHPRRDASGSGSSSSTCRSAWPRRVLSARLIRESKAERRARSTCSARSSSPRA